MMYGVRVSLLALSLGVRDLCLVKHSVSVLGLACFEHIHRAK